MTINGGYLILSIFLAVINRDGHKSLSKLLHFIDLKNSHRLQDESMQSLGKGYLVPLQPLF